MDKISFPTRTEFDQVIKDRVNNYFKENHMVQTGNYLLHLKAALIVSVLLLSYFLLVFKVESALWSLGLLFVFVQSQILLAFNVMHDGGHQSFSSKKWVNDFACKIMDFLGGSSLIWKQKHNTIHHTYTNVSGKDDDLDVGNMMRLSPEQPHKPWFRYQHWYGFILYSFLSLYLLVYSDFQRIISNSIGVTPLQTYNKKELVFFILSKILYITYTLVIPMFFHSPWVVILYFILAHMILGLTLSVVFQLAHTVMEAKFPTPNPNGTMPYSWVEHQLSTTCNFAPNNKVVTFYCGGLNYQVEHHLFHRISHTHYPQISKIIKKTCEEYNKPYIVSETFFKALQSHFRFLKQMGKAPL